MKGERKERNFFYFIVFYVKTKQAWRAEQAKNERHFNYFKGSFTYNNYLKSFTLL